MGLLISKEAFSGEGVEEEIDSTTPLRGLQNGEEASELVGETMTLLKGWACVAGWGDIFLRSGFGRWTLLRLPQCVSRWVIGVRARN